MLGPILEKNYWINKLGTVLSFMQNSCLRCKIFIWCLNALKQKLEDELNRNNSKAMINSSPRHRQKVTWIKWSLWKECSKLFLFISIFYLLQTYPRKVPNTHTKPTIWVARSIHPLFGENPDKNYLYTRRKAFTINLPSTWYDFLDIHNSCSNRRTA